MNDARGTAAVAGRADTHDGTTVRAGRVRHEADHPAVEALAHHTQSERAPGLRPCRVPVINGPALKIGPTVFLGIEQAAGRQSLLAVGAERHITCPSAYRAIGASVQKLWRAFGKLGVGSPALLFSFPLGCRW